uniref:Exportin-1/Importin-beta-like domain-containing protein n=1 Tax=Lotharella globosa TaxID=91324 RepID=A0A7S4DM05_9EUKA
MNGNMGESVKLVLQAVQALFNPDTPPDKREDANRWVINFKKRKEAWQVANIILGQPNLGREAYNYAAFTLRTKIMYDFQDLKTPELRRQLRDQVMKHAFNHVGDSVRVQLALAVTMLAIHMVENEWQTALKDIVRGLGKNPRTAMVLLDILTMLPEECVNRRIRCRRKVQEHAKETFSKDAAKILGVLKTYMHQAGANVQLQKKVYSCFLSWVRYCNVSAEMLMNDPLFKFTFQAVRKEELFNIAVEVLTELVVLTADMKKYTPAVRILVPQILSLGGKYDAALREGDEETCKTLTRLFVEMGERYMPMILAGGTEASQAVAILLKCSSNPDKSIASMTFNFWYLVSRKVTGSEDQKLKALFKQPFMQMVVRLKNVMQYPPEVKQVSDDRQALDDYKRYRYFAADALVDTESVVGIRPVLHVLLKELQKEWAAYQKNPQNWQAVEACLYCFRSVAKRVPANESEILPQLMRFILTPMLEQHSALRYTSTLIVGRFNEWINSHPDFIQPLLNFVVKGLQHNLLLVVSSAAYAFNYVCLGCSRILAERFMGPLFQVYTRSSGLRINERKEIVEGVTCVIGKLPKHKYREALTELIKPLAAVLQRAAESKVVNDEHKTQVSHALDLIAQAFMTLPERGAEQAAIILSQLKGLLDNAMKRYLADDALMERVCRCWKYGIRATKLHFKPMLPPLLHQLSQYFPKYPHSSFLYIVCVCVNEFGAHLQYQELLARAYKTFSEHGMSTLKTAEAYNQKPDIVGDFFDMQKRYLTHCPQIVFGSELIVHVFKCALVGVFVGHKDACSMLMKFFATFIKSGAELQHRPDRIPNSGPATKMLQSIMINYGERLTTGLMQGIAGKLPSSRIDFVIEVIEVT